jgi:hypothetical protein
MTNSSVEKIDTSGRRKAFVKQLKEKCNPRGGYAFAVGIKTNGLTLGSRRNCYR